MASHREQGMGKVVRKDPRRPWSRSKAMFPSAVERSHFYTFYTLSFTLSLGSSLSYPGHEFYTVVPAQDGWGTRAGAEPWPGPECV